jgi:hypothetical protein
VAGALNTYVDRQHEAQVAQTQAGYAERLQQLKLDAVARNVAARDATQLEKARLIDKAHVDAANISEQAKKDWQQQKGVDDRAMQALLAARKVGANPPPMPTDGSQKSWTDWASATETAADYKRNGVPQRDAQGNEIPGSRRGGLVQQGANFYSGLLDRQAAIQDKMDGLDAASLKNAKDVVFNSNDNAPGSWVEKNIPPTSPQYAAFHNDKSGNPMAALAAAGLDGQYTNDLQSQVQRQQTFEVAKTYPAQAKIYATELQDVDSALKAYQAKYGGSDWDHEAMSAGYGLHQQNLSQRHTQEAVQMLQAQAKAAGVEDWRSVTTPEQLTAIQQATALKTQQTAQTTAATLKKTAYESAQAKQNSFENMGISGEIGRVGNPLWSVGRGMVAPVNAFVPGTPENRLAVDPSAWAALPNWVNMRTPGAAAPTPQEIAAFAQSRGYQIGSNGAPVPRPNNLVIPNGAPVAAPVAGATVLGPPYNPIQGLPPMSVMPDTSSGYNYDQALRLMPSAGAPPVPAGVYPSAVNATMQSQQADNNSAYGSLRLP